KVGRVAEPFRNGVEELVLGSATLRLARSQIRDELTQRLLDVVGHGAVGPVESLRCPVVAIVVAVADAVHARRPIPFDSPTVELATETLALHVGVELDDASAGPHFAAQRAIRVTQFHGCDRMTEIADLVAVGVEDLAIDPDGGLDLVLPTTLIDPR